MTIGDWIRSAEEQLAMAGVDSPRLDAQLIVAHVVGESRSWVLAHLGDGFDVSVAEGLLTRRLDREPLSYLVGHREFFGRRFGVSSSVLVPRPETEELVEVVLDALPGAGMRVLDFGTGSGCIAVTLKLERPAWVVSALDVSEEALEVAKANAESLGADVDFHHSDGFSGLGDEQFDVVVSNPPYIEPGTVLMAEVGRFEPGEALFADEDGYRFYRMLAEESGRVGATKVFVEIGIGMEEGVGGLFVRNGWREIVRRADLSGTIRVLGFER